MLTFLSIVLFLAILSVVLGFKDSYYWELRLQRNTFKTPYYAFGLMYDQFEGLDENGKRNTIDIFTIGIIIFQLEFTFFKQP